MVFEHPPVTAHHSGSDRTDCRLDSLCLPIDDSEFTIRLGCLGTLLLGGENWTYKLEFLIARMSVTGTKFHSRKQRVHPSVFKWVSRA
jgi:hypothetical protein